MSVEYTLDREYSGAVVKPTWLFTTMCTVPPVPVPAQLGQVQRLGHHALAGECGVSM